MVSTMVDGTPCAGRYVLWVFLTGDLHILIPSPFSPSPLIPLGYCK